MSILEEIFSRKQSDLIGIKQARPFDLVCQDAKNAPMPRDFTAALRSSKCRPALIAEIKRASPSKGAINPDLDPVHMAGMYIQGGASAVSVLTETNYFKGSLDDLKMVRGLMDRNPTGLPVLRKDFLCDPYQIYEARAAGADALLLIAAFLNHNQLGALFKLTCELGMTPLIEVHNRNELDMVLELKPPLVGINNRDLKDFSVRLETTLELCEFIPKGTCLVAESGIHDKIDVDRLADAGVNAILVGEALVKADDPVAQIRRLYE